MPETSNSDKEYRAAASVSARSDGKMCYATNAYYRDGDFVASGGISNSLFKGIEILKDATSSFFSANEKPAQESSADNDNEPKEENNSAFEDDEEIIDLDREESKNSFVDEHDEKKSNEPENKTNGKAQPENKNEAVIKASSAEGSDGDESYEQEGHRSHQEYAALQRKGIMVNEQMSYNDDAIDGEFLSKLDSHEFGINIEQNKFLVFLNMDGKGNIHFKEYDLNIATKLKDDYCKKHGLLRNDVSWNTKYSEALDKLSRKNEHAQNYKRMEEAWDRSIKKEYPAEFVRKIDQYYIVIKVMAGASYIEGKHYLKEEYPDIYNTAAETISSIGNGIKSSDEYLESSLVSGGWKTFKYGVGEIAKDIHKNQAEFVGDMLLALYGEGIGGAVFSGAKTAVKASASASSKLLGKGIASKLDDVTRVALHTQTPHVPSKTATTAYRKSCYNSYKKRYSSYC